jgi:hypothetical protein
VGVAVVVDQRVAGLPHRPRLRLHADAAGLRRVDLAVDLVAQLVRTPRHLGDERPEPLVQRRVRQPLRADDDPAVEPPSPGLQDEEEALDVLQAVHARRRDARPVEEEQLTAFEHGAHAPRLPGPSRAKPARDYATGCFASSARSSGVGSLAAARCS